MSAQILIRSAVTVGLFLLYVLLLLRSWSARARAEFSAAAQLPLQDEQTIGPRAGPGADAAGDARQGRL